MSHDEIRSALNDRSPSVRLAAARAARQLNDEAVLALLRTSRSEETDSWVRRALDQAIAHIVTSATQPIPVVGDAASQSEIDSEAFEAQALQTVTETVVHELRPIMGDIRQSAELEIADYDTSETAKYVGRLQDFLDVLTVLHIVSEAPRVEEVDLTDLIAEICLDASRPGRQILPARTDTTVAKADPRLLRHAITNLVRNAIEASPENGSIIVGCAVTDVDVWVAVLDEGPGPPSDIGATFQPGFTQKSKDEHFGMGLTIARQAIRSLSGQISLTPREGGGARAEIRWPILGANA